MNERAERDLELLGMSRAEFSRSKIFGYWGYAMDVLAAAISAIVANLLTQNQAAIGAVIAILPVFVGYLLKQKARSIYLDAEDARRITVLIKALNYPLSEKKFQEIIKPFSKHSRGQAQKDLEESRKYYASRQPYGAFRLLEMFQESVFWTGALMGKASHLVLILSLVIGGLLFLSLYMLLFANLAVNRIWWSSVLAAGILVYLTTGFYHLWRSYAKISNRLQRMDDELEILRTKGSAVELSELLALLNEYDTLMATAAPVPDFVYRLHKKELNRIWELRQSSYTAKS